MATHLTLLCHAATRAMREGGFATSRDPLDQGGERKLAAFRLDGPPAARLLTSDAWAARQTAGRFGAAEPEPALADIDVGGWAGRSIADLAASDRPAFEGWIADPAAGTPGGESMRSVMLRVADWLDRIAGSDDRILAVSHAAVLRAAIAVVLNAPPENALHVDIAPLTAVTLSFNGRWRLREIRAG